MPLVRIDLLQGKPKEYVAAIGESVHRAMVETIGVPARDHFQVITEHAPGYLVYDPHYLEVNRSDDVVFIQIFFSAGRSREEKQGFFKRVVEYLREKPGLRPEDVAINLVENSRERMVQDAQPLAALSDFEGLPQHAPTARMRSGA